MRQRTLLLLLPVCLLAQPKQIANYNISARLLPDQHAVSGRESLTWLNDSGDAIGELQFHLYMNAFRNSKSTFMQESGGGALRGDRAKKDSWGWIDIKRIEVAGGEDLTKRIEFIHPDDNNADDRTVIRVALPKPVKPSESVTLNIEFYTKFPHVFARTGFHGNFYLGGQWFPKIGVYERIGVRGAEQGRWNTHQFHAHSEFYADYGKYAVDLTVPSEYVVGATGVQKQRKDNADKTATYSFYQENVHDFAWTAQPGYLKLERTFSAEAEVPPMELSETARKLGITHEEARLSDVRMILLLQPEHAHQAEKHFKAVAAGIKYFGLWYGRYPHQTITVVDPPYGGSGAGGMEYPTFITAGTSWQVGANDGRPEEVTVHEFGHQFWQGLVGNNEFEEAWMDEGFNTYSTGKVIDKVYGRTGLPVNLLGIPITRLINTPTVNSIVLDRIQYLVGPKLDNLSRAAWQYQSDLSYGLNSYGRPGLMLLTLENTLGEEVMGRVMRTYQQRWRYGHPGAQDFIKVAEEISGKDLKWFFDQFVFGSNAIDYAVGEVTSEAVQAHIGRVGSDEPAKIVTSAEARKLDEAVEKSKKQLYDTKVTIRREGEAIIPVNIAIRFENGEVEKRLWDGQYRWIRYEFRKGSKVSSVEVDPDHRLVLDINWTNNSYVEKPDSRVVWKWSSTILFWVQQILTTASAFA